MSLKCVTLTGADDTVQPEQLVELSQKYDFVEWGILVSHTWTGQPLPNPRWPSEEWLARLQQAGKDHDLKLSLHICGRWVRYMLYGEFALPLWLLRSFQRVQLNFHRDSSPRYRCNLFAAALQKFIGRQVIFQLDGNCGKSYLNDLYLNESEVDAVSLYDVSGGAGISPVTWPEANYLTGPDTYAYHGYAGGLGPHNIAEELVRIDKASKGAPIWIDMESKVRSVVNGQDLFDLAKVRQVLEVCKPYVS
jgi:hypothetical protein